MQLIFYLKASLSLGANGVVLIALLQPNSEFSKSQASKATPGPKFQSFKFVPQSMPSLAPTAGSSASKENLASLSRNLVKKTTGLRDFRDELDDMDNLETPVPRKEPSALFAGSKTPNPGNGSSMVEGSIGLGVPRTVKSTSPSGSSPDEESGMPEVKCDNSTSPQASRETREEILLGTTELSLDSSTRSSFFGLVNPIKVCFTNFHNCIALKCGHVMYIFSFINT